jgi:hypothetical protein
MRSRAVTHPLTSNSFIQRSLITFGTFQVSIEADPLVACRRRLQCSYRQSATAAACRRVQVVPEFQSLESLSRHGQTRPPYIAKDAEQPIFSTASVVPLRSR